MNEYIKNKNRNQVLKSTETKTHYVLCPVDCFFLVTFSVFLSLSHSFSLTQIIIAFALMRENCKSRNVPNGQIHICTIFNRPQT